MSGKYFNFTANENNKGREASSVELILQSVIRISRLANTCSTECMRVVQKFDDA